MTITAPVTRYGTGTLATGTVAITDAGVPIGTPALDGSMTASMTTASLSRGTHPLRAAYSGDATFAASNSPLVNLAVNAPGAASTTTTLTSSLNPSYVTESVTLTAAVTGTGTPTGVVEFRENGRSIGSGALDGTGHASFATTSLTAGTHTITAEYQGDETHAASISSSLAQVVNSIEVNVTLTSTPNPSTGAEPVTFTATVTPASNPTPLTGTVSFLEGSTVLASAPIDGTGTATAAISTLAPGTHPVTASYGGDPTYGAAASAVVNQVVTGVPTTTVLSSGSNPSDQALPVTLVATVHATVGSAIPTGTVTFSETGDVIGVVDLDATGKAVLTVGGAGIGVHPISAVYSGDLFRTASTAPPLQQFVVPSGSFGLQNEATSGPEHCVFCDPVNSATGNLTEQISDIAVKGRGLGVEFSRAYNSQGALAPTAGPIGWGWTFSYGASATTNPITGVVTVRQPNGATVNFTSADASTFTASANVTASLVRNGDQTLRFTLADGRTSLFAADGRLLSLSDRTGETTTLSYTSGRLTSIADPAGRTLTVGWTGGQISSVSDPAGRSVTYGHDAGGNLTSVTDVANKTTSYAYDAGHELTITTNPDGGTVTNVYDAQGRVTKQTDGINRATTFSYAPGATTVTDPRGNAQVLEFDAAGNNTHYTRGAGTPATSTWIYGYDAADNLISTTDPNGHVSTATWDGRGNKLTATDGLNRTTTYTYDAFNNVTSVTDPLGVATMMTYDTRGLLTGTSRPLVGAVPAASATMGFVRDATHPGDVVQVIDQLAKTTTLAYNAAGDLTSSLDPTGAKTTFGYDGISRRASMVSPRGNVAGGSPAMYTTRYTYAPWGAVATVTDPLGGVTTTGYDAMRRVATETDADHKTTGYGYDLAGQQITETRGDGSVNKTGYDGAGNMATQTDGLNHSTSYGHDEQNRLTTVTDPLGRATTAGYDLAGNRTTVLDAAGKTKTQAFDAANQLTSIVYSDGVTPNVTYGYDADGQRTSMVDGTGTTTFTWDSLHRLIGQGSDGLVTDPNTLLGFIYTLTYGYDLAGRQTSLDYGNGGGDLTSNGVTVHVGEGVVHRGYDDAGRMTSVTDFFGRTATFGYDPDGNLTTTAYPNGTTSTRTYDANGRVTRVTHAGSGATFLNEPYTYSAAGQLATTAIEPATGTGSKAYGYDANQRLTTNNIPLPLGGPAPLYGYGFDAADNLTRITVGAVQNDLAHNNANELTSVTATATGKSITYTSDVKGNRTKAVDGLGNTVTYSWDQEDRLTGYAGPVLNAISSAAASQGVSQAANLQLHWGYNGDGLRGDLTWDRSGPMPVVIGDQHNLIAYITGPDGLPLERIDYAGQHAVALWYHTDRQGSVRALTNDNGLLVTSYAYDPFGRQTPAGTQVANPFGYTGQYTDLTTGLLYLRARWYDSGTAHFLSRDPIALLTRQPYVYARSNPINRSDPAGLCSCGVGDVVPQGLTTTAAVSSLLLLLMNEPLAASILGAGGVAISAVAYGLCLRGTLPGPCAPYLADALIGAVAVGIGANVSIPFFVLGAALLSVSLESILLYRLSNDPCP